MSSSEERVGGVEPETVEMYRARDFPEARWMECAPDTRHTIALYPNEYEVERFVEASALRLVEEELRQERDLRRRAERSRENANRVLRQAREEEASWERAYDSTIDELHDTQAKLSMARAGAKADWDGLDRQVKLRDVAEQALIAAEADRDRLAEALRQAREVAHSRLRDRARLVRRAERAEADLGLLTRRFALVASRSGVRAQALQLAQECITENLANGEGVDSQPAVLDAIFDALKYEIADEPDGARPGAEPPIQSTPVSPVQGEHEQDGEDAGGPSLDEVYAERNKVVLAFAALVKEQGWDVGLTVDPSSPDWPVLMIETDAGQVSWHFQAGELPPGLPLFAGKWDGHSTPEKYARLAELVRSAFGLSGEIAQDGDTEETT